MYLKAALFLGILCLSAGLLLAASPSLRVAALIALVSWSSARLYYFLFYVIERYIDPGFRFAGLFSAVRCLLPPGRPAAGGKDRAAAAAEER